MNEYQYSEFQAVDRPLAEAAAMPMLAPRYSADTEHPLPFEAARTIGTAQANRETKREDFSRRHRAGFSHWNRSKERCKNKKGLTSV